MSDNAQVPPAKPALLRQGLRLIAAVVLVGGLGFWAAKGANVGWNKDQVPMKNTDEVTGIEYVTYVKRFVPGVEFLALSAGLAAGLFIVSFFVPRKTNTPTT